MLTLDSLKIIILGIKTSSKKIHSLIKKYGIDITKPIILYSKNKLEASRLAVILLETGAEDVRILDGGFNSWLNKKIST